MSRPRPVYPGDCTMAQKQCYGQQFRLRPDADVVQTILYTLAYTANKYDIELHDFVVMSNHDHIVSTDPEGARPLFIGLFHSLVARAINSRFGDVDALWSSRRYSSPRLLEGDDVFAKCVYTLLNPVQAHLVRYAWDWQGPSSYALEYDKPVIIKKPNFFFSKNMPNEVSLVLRRPKKLESPLESRELRTKIRAAVKVQQGEIAAASRRSGRTFMGMGRVLRQPRNATPHTREIRKGIRPHIASRSKWARIEALQDLKLFWAAHEAAMRAEQQGHTAEYPYGSYRAKLLGRPCARAP